MLRYDEYRGTMACRLGDEHGENALYMAPPSLRVAKFLKYAPFGPLWAACPDGRSG